jgi:catabolite regulation protein CreA
MLLSQRKQFKDRHTIILSRDRIVRVHTEKRIISTWIYVTTSDGAVCGFNRGLMSADPIMAVLEGR